MPCGHVHGINWGQQLWQLLGAAWMVLPGQHSYHRCSLQDKEPQLQDGV